jgi:hypothetical protein
MTKRLTGIPADRARSYLSIESEATSVRNILGCDPSERIDVWHFFNFQLGEICLEVGGKDIDIVEVIEDCKPEGMSRWDCEAGRLELVLSADTYDLLRSDHIRARYTVLHEFGHIIQHTAQIIRLAGLSLTSQIALHRLKTEHAAYLDTEWQANAFASAMLMPATGVRELTNQNAELRANQIARHFGASEEAARYRLESVRRVL